MKTINHAIKEILGDEYETFYLYAEKRDGMGAISAHYHGENSQGVCESGRGQSRFALRMFLYNVLGYVYASIDEPQFPPDEVKGGEKEAQ